MRVDSQLGGSAAGSKLLLAPDAQEELCLAGAERGNAFNILQTVPPSKARLDVWHGFGKMHSIGIEVHAGRHPWIGVHPQNGADSKTARWHRIDSKADVTRRCRVDVSDKWVIDFVGRAEKGGIELRRGRLTQRLIGPKGEGVCAGGQCYLSELPPVRRTLLVDPLYSQ